MLFLVVHREAASANNLGGQPGEKIATDFFAFSFLRPIAVTDSNFRDAEWSVGHEIGAYILALAQRLKYRLRE